MVFLKYSDIELTEKLSSYLVTNCNNIEDVSTKTLHDAANSIYKTSYGKNRVKVYRHWTENIQNVQEQFKIKLNLLSDKSDANVKKIVNINKLLGPENIQEKEEENANTEPSSKPLQSEPINQVEEKNSSDHCPAHDTYLHRSGEVNGTSVDLRQTEGAENEVTSSIKCSQNILNENNTEPLFDLESSINNLPTKSLIDSKKTLKSTSSAFQIVFETSNIFLNDFPNCNDNKSDSASDCSFDLTIENNGNISPIQNDFDHNSNINQEKNSLEEIEGEKTKSDINSSVSDSFKDNDEYRTSSPEKSCGEQSTSELSRARKKIDFDEVLGYLDDSLESSENSFQVVQNPHMNTYLFEKSYIIPKAQFDTIFQKGKLIPREYCEIFIKYFETADLYCVLQVKQQRVNETYDRNAWIVVYAYCVHVDCKRYKLIVQKPPKNGSDVSVDIYSTGTFNHEGKRTRQVRSSKRKQVIEVLKHTKPAKYRSQTVIAADPKTMLMGNMQEVKHNATIWKIRSEANAEGDYHSQDILDVILQFLKEEGTSHQFIQKISVPLSAILFTKEQLEVFIQYCQKSGKPKPIVHADSTGNLVRPPPGFAKKTIFNYALVVNIGGKIFSVSDFVSAEQSAVAISSWLSFWKYALQKITKSWPLFSFIVVDFSFAMINAILHAFNMMTLSSYLSLIYKISMKEIDNSDLAIVHVHICCAHFVKIITKDTASVVQEKKLRYAINVHFGKLITCIEYQDFLARFKSLCVFLLSEYETPEFLLAKERLEKLKHYEVLTPEEIEKVDLDEEEILGLDELNKTVRERSRFYIDAKEKKAEAEKIVNLRTEHPLEEHPRNVYYFPQLIEKYLEKSAAFAGLWSAFLFPLTSHNINKLSNSVAENNFNRLKNDEMDGLINTKVGRFIRNRAERNASYCKEIILDIPECRRKKRKVIDESGKAVSPKTKRNARSGSNKSSYLVEEINKDCTLAENEVLVPSTSGCSLDVSRDIDVDSMNQKEAWKRKKATNLANCNKIQSESRVSRMEEQITISDNETENTVTNTDNEKISQKTIDELSKRSTRVPQNLDVKNHREIFNHNEFPENWFRRSVDIAKIDMTYISLKCLLDNVNIDDKVLMAFMLTRVDLAMSYNMKVLLFETYTITGMVENKRTFLNMIDKDDGFSKDLWLIPVNVHGTHWILFTVDLKNKFITCIDSLYPENDYKAHGAEYLPYVRQYMHESYLRKHKCHINWEEWHIFFPKDINQQGSSNDCGVHVMVWSHIICTGSKLQFSQRDMRHARRWIMHEILDAYICNSVKKAFVARVIELLSSGTVAEIRLPRPKIVLERVPGSYKSTIEYYASLSEFYMVNMGKCYFGAKCTAVDSQIYRCNGPCNQDYHLICSRMDHMKTPDPFFCPSCKTPQR